MPPASAALSADCWPTADQELLLTAALATGERARDAWMRWRSDKNLPSWEWDAASYRLLPLLARNLAREQVVDSFLPSLRSVQRHHWFRNQTLLAGLAAVVRTLQARGCAVIVLKGAALALRYYASPGDRPMEDVDLLVPTHQFEPAMDALAGSGWRAEARGPAFLNHSFALTDANGLRCDLHRHLLRESSTAAADALSWADAGRVRFAGVEAGVLCDTDQLLHAFVHGVRWNDSVAPLRWVADALHVLRHPATRIDWSRLRERAAAHFMVGLSVAAALHYLHERFGAEVPGDVLDALHPEAFRAEERVAFARYLRPRASLGPAETWRFVRFDYGLVAPPGRWARLAGFVTYLQHTWKLSSALLVPPRLAWATLRAGVRGASAGLLRSGGRA